MAGWWSWRGAWVHLYGPVLYDNATGLGSYLPSVVSAAPESWQNQSTSLLFYPSERSGRTCGRLPAPRAHDRPFLVMDHLTPSSIPPAFPSWRALRLVMADPSCRGPWNFCLHGLLLRLGLFPVEAGWAHQRRGLLLMDIPVPMGATPLLGGLRCPSRMREAMRPSVLEQADGPGARVCWHSGQAHGEESVEGRGADQREARSPGRARLNRQERRRCWRRHRRTGPHAPASNEEATVAFSC